MSNNIDDLLNQLSSKLENDKSETVNDFLKKLGISKEEAKVKLQSIDKNQLAKSLEKLSLDDLKKIKDIDTDQ